MLQGLSEYQQIVSYEVQVLCVTATVLNNLAEPKQCHKSRNMSSPSQRVTEKGLRGPLGLLELRRFTLGSFLLCAKLVFVILEGAVAAD